MKAYTYIEKGHFELLDKSKPELQNPKDAIVRVTLSSICSSDLHIKHGSVPRAVPGITVGHEMVGIVDQVGSEVKTVSPGDRITVNVETFCGECFFCKNGYVNNCTDPNGGWAARISEIKEDDTVLIIGAGPTGLCTLQCVMLKNPKKIIVSEMSSERRAFVQHHYPAVQVVKPEECLNVAQGLERGGADVVIEVAGAELMYKLFDLVSGSLEEVNQFL